MADRDRDIRDAFDRLKAGDESIVPEFQLADAGERWRWRHGVIASVGAAVVLVVGAIFLPEFQGSDPVEPTAEAAAISVSPFDDYTDAISENLLVASLTDWESPTDFLLDIDTTLTEIEK